MSQVVYDRLLKHKIVAIVRGFDPETVVKLAYAYVDGGIRCIEVTFDQASHESRLQTVRAIEALKEEFGDAICVGAGTVMTAEQARMAAAAGAEYMIAPNVDAEVIAEAKALGKLAVPGAMTPTEIALGYKLGGDIIKLFPANEVGLGYIKAIKAPLNHIPILAAGGVRPENAADYLKAGCCALGIGGDLVNRQWIAAGEYHKITQVARAYVAAVTKME